MPQEAQYAGQASRTRVAETKRRQARELLEVTTTEVIALELLLGIEEHRRWTPTTPEYIETLAHIAEREYREAARNLERLVVQRLFELHKLRLNLICKW